MREQTLSREYTMVEGYPTPETVQHTYNEADLNRAIEAYRFFYPTVSGAAIFKGYQNAGLVANTVFGVQETFPRHVGLTLNSDTPYGPILLDLHQGPMVLELPPGPLICVTFDVNHRWVADMGLPGPDAGKGGKHVILPPDWKGEVPGGYHVWRSGTYRVIIGFRSLPVQGNMQAALDRLQTVKVSPLHVPDGWKQGRWVNLTEAPQDISLLRWETTLTYWEVLHEIIDTEPPYEGYRTFYGELAALGITKGKPFALDARKERLLEQAAQIGNAQMRVQSFADRRPDRVVWKDRQWEWACLRFENGDFETASSVDLDAREKWFFQAIAMSPAMVRRQVGAGSVYWLGLRDRDGSYLDGSKTYTLTIPQPVPANLFWSVTVYDAQTRSQIQTDQGYAALRSLFELKGLTGEKIVNLFFGPTPPAGKEAQWIKTIPGRGWFVYLRLYGPLAPAFDGSWKPGDFTTTR